MSAFAFNDVLVKRVVIRFRVYDKMNFLQSTLHSIVRSTLFRHHNAVPSMIVRSAPSFCQLYANRFLQGCRNISTLKQIHKKGERKKPAKTRRPLDGNPYLKAIVLRNVIKKPRKPNSANRKCVMVRLSNGKEKIAYVPGVGHNLQEHNVVLVRCGRVQDCTGIHLKCVRDRSLVQAAAIDIFAAIALQAACVFFSILFNKFRNH